MYVVKCGDHTLDRDKVAGLLNADSQQGWNPLLYKSLPTVHVDDLVSAQAQRALSSDAALQPVGVFQGILRQQCNNNELPGLRASTGKKLLSDHQIRISNRGGATRSSWVQRPMPTSWAPTS